MTRNLQVNGVEHVGTGVPPIPQILAGNPDRVWLVITVTTPGFVYCTATQDQTAATAFYATGQPGTQVFLRKDVGSLVTGAVWVSDGAGNDTGATVIISEGVLVGL